MPELFADRLRDYRATVHSHLPEALAGIGSLLVPGDLAREWLDGFAVEVVVDHMLTHSEIDGVEGVLTGCTVAIAETGAMVLDAGPAQR